jgi:hypothetical protein
MDCSVNSHVEGWVFHKSLSLEKGTHFEGESRPSTIRCLSQKLTRLNHGETTKYLRS